MLVEGFECAFGHHGLWDDAEFFDLVLFHQHILSIEAFEDDDLGISFDEEAVEDTTVGGDEKMVLEAFSDFDAGVDDAGEDSFEVIAGEGSEVGSDASAFFEKEVAAAAVLHEELFTDSWVPGAGGECFHYGSGFCLNLSGCHACGGEVKAFECGLDGGSVVELHATDGCW